MYDVVSIADVCADLIIIGNEKPCFGQVEKLAESYELELGGSASIFASQFSKLGGKVALIGSLGQDTLGAFLLERLNQLGIDTSHLQITSTSKTPLGLNLSVKEDRAMITVLGSMAEISFLQISDEVLHQTRHWHIAGFFLLQQLISKWPEFIQKLITRNITISLDTNWAPNGDWHHVIELLPTIDVFLPNENEAMAITKKHDYKSAGIYLSEIGKLIVIKRGSEGASAFLNGKEIIATIPSKSNSTIQVVDTTGAGDSFDGGFIYEWLKGSSIDQCLNTGIACGTSSVQKAGGINGQLVIL